MTRHQLPARRPRHRRAKRGFRALTWSALLLSLLLIVAACGNDDADATTEAAAEATAQATPATEAEESTDAGADEVPDAIADLASNSGSATVTIGDETFEFTLAGTSTVDGSTHVGRCESLFGMILGSGFATDGRDVTLDIEIHPSTGKRSRTTASTRRPSRSRTTWPTPAGSPTRRTSSSLAAVSASTSRRT